MLITQQKSAYLTMDLLDSEPPQTSSGFEPEFYNLVYSLKYGTFTMMQGRRQKKFEPSNAAVLQTKVFTNSFEDALFSTMRLDRINSASARHDFDLDKDLYLCIKFEKNIDHSSIDVLSALPSLKMVEHDFDIVSCLFETNNAKLIVDVGAATGFTVVINDLSLRYAPIESTVVTSVCSVASSFNDALIKCIKTLYNEAEKANVQHVRTDCITFSSGFSPTATLVFRANGDLEWNGRVVQSDEELKQAVIDVKNILTPKPCKDSEQ
jgi:hypothetical protein